MRAKELEQAPAIDFKFLYGMGLRIAKGLNNGKAPDGFRLEQIVTTGNGRTGFIISYLDINSPLSNLFGKSFGHERVFKFIKLNKDNEEESIEMYHPK